MKAEIEFFDGERLVVSQDPINPGSGLSCREATVIERYVSKSHDELLQAIKGIYGSCTCKETARKEIIQLLCKYDACAPWASEELKESLAEVYALCTA